MDPLLNLLIPQQMKKMVLNPLTASSNESKALKLFCVNVARAAFQHYLDGNLREFDPIVGENACQIRTLMLQEMIVNQTIDKERLGRLVMKLDQLRERIIPNQPTAEEERLEELTDQEKFLIRSHLLTYVRMRSQPTESDESQLDDFCAPLSLKADDLITLITQINPYKTLVDISFKVKSDLSLSSIAYVQKIAKQHLERQRKLDSSLDQSLTPDYAFLAKVLQQPKDANGQNLMATPMFYNIVAIMEHIKMHQHLLILNLDDQHHLAFKADEAGCFIPIDDPSSIENDPAFVIKCKVSNDALETDLMDMIDILKINRGDSLTRFILANAADHPLYAGRCKKMSLKYFENADVKGFLNRIRSTNIDEIKKTLNAQTDRKPINRANASCNPFTLAQVIAEYHSLQALKEEGQRVKQLIAIQHIYCNTLKKEQSVAYEAGEESGLMHSTEFALTEIGQ